MQTPTQLPKPKAIKMEFSERHILTSAIPTVIFSVNGSLSIEGVQKGGQALRFRNIQKEAFKIALTLFQIGDDGKRILLQSSCRCQHRRKAGEDAGGGITGECRWGGEQG